MREWGISRLRPVTSTGYTEAVLAPIVKRPDRMSGKLGNRLDAHRDLAHALRVLIVDDEMLIRWALGQALGARGCVVTEAATAREARAAIHAAPFDIIVLDYRLPDTAHLDLLREIRTCAPSSQVVMMTAFGAPEMVTEATGLGVNRVLEKPIDLDVAVRAILNL